MAGSMYSFTFTGEKHRRCSHIRPYMYWPLYLFIRGQTMEKTAGTNSFRPWKRDSPALRQRTVEHWDWRNSLYWCQYRQVSQEENLREATRRKHHWGRGYRSQSEVDLGTQCRTWQSSYRRMWEYVFLHFLPSKFDDLFIVTSVHLSLSIKQYARRPDNRLHTFRW